VYLFRVLQAQGEVRDAWKLTKRFEFISMRLHEIYCEAILL